MFNYTARDIISYANKYGFVKETLEKVLRLVDVLRIICFDSELSSFLVLKGGTAINFTVLKLPRLSVDIDLDFSYLCDKDEMLEIRSKLNNKIINYLERDEYELSSASKYRHSLDSLVFKYKNLFGNNDNIKIEINYMNRCHILLYERKQINIDFIDSFEIRTLNKIELYASKINALIERCTVRDIYDVYKMLDNEIIGKEDFNLFKKSALFYLGSSGHNILNFDDALSIFYKKIDFISTYTRAPQYLSSTLKNKEHINMNDMCNKVKTFIKTLLVLDNSEFSSYSKLAENIYDPSLLFPKDYNINNINKHPMMIWQINKNNNS